MTIAICVQLYAHDVNKLRGLGISVLALVPATAISSTPAASAFAAAATTASTGTALPIAAPAILSTEVLVVLSPCLVLQHGLLGVVAQFDLVRRGPWMVHELGGHRLELRNPSANVLALLVVIFGLLNDIEETR